MLHLVPPPGSAPPHRRGGAPSHALRLTDDEARHLRAATRNIAKSYGGLAALARALGCCPGILTRKKRPGAGLAVALARLTRIPVETLLSGKLTAVQAPPIVPPRDIA